MKEPKEKHVLFILECLKGKHLSLIRPKEAFAKLFDRFFNNLRSFSLIIKTLIILHRALQEDDISLMVAHRIKEKENLLYPYQVEEQSYGLKDLQHHTKSLSVKELFMIFSRIDTIIESIIKVYEQKAYCQKHRNLHTVIYLLFVDLLKIYQSYYLLISEMLNKLDEMNLKDAKRAFIIYLNLVKINKEIRKMAASAIKEFNINLAINFYEIEETKIVEAMKISIETKEREKLGGKRGIRNSGGGREHTGSDESNNCFNHDSHSNSSKDSGKPLPKNKIIEFQTEEKEKINKRMTMHQGGQGMQGNCMDSPLLENLFSDEMNEKLTKEGEEKLCNDYLKKCFTLGSMKNQCDIIKQQPKQELKLPSNFQIDQYPTQELEQQLDQMLFSKQNTLDPEQLRDLYRQREMQISQIQQKELILTPDQQHEDVITPIFHIHQTQPLVITPKKSTEKKKKRISFADQFIYDQVIQPHDEHNPGQSFEELKEIDELDENQLTEALEMQKPLITGDNEEDLFFEDASQNHDVSSDPNIVGTLMGYEQNEEEKEIEDDEDQFKSIMVQDEVRDEFFEVISSPKVPQLLTKETLRKLSSSDKYHHQQDVDESFQSCI